MTSTHAIDHLLSINHSSPQPLNETNEFGSYDIATIVGSMATACLCLAGLCGNLISILIFTRPVMNSSINVLLTGISLIDITVILLAVPVFVLPSLDNVLRFNYVRQFYSVAILGVYPLALMAQTSSVWTFVLISVERYLAVCRPLEVVRSLSPSRARQAQLLVILCAVMYNFVRFWEYKLGGQEKKADDVVRPSDSADRDQVVPNLRENQIYFVLYFSVLFQLTHFVVPFLTISSLNYFILKAIKRAFKDRQRMSGSQRNQYRTCRMIIVVTAIFGACNFPVLSLNLWEIIDQSLYDGRHSNSAYFLLDVSNTAVLINSSTNFVIYLIYCDKYRKLFYSYLVRCRWRASTAAVGGAARVSASVAAVAAGQPIVPVKTGLLTKVKNSSRCRRQRTMNGCLTVKPPPMTNRRNGSCTTVSVTSDDPTIRYSLVSNPCIDL